MVGYGPALVMFPVPTPPAPYLEATGKFDVYYVAVVYIYYIFQKADKSVFEIVWVAKILY